MSNDEDSVTLFVVPHCPLCAQVQQWLDDHQVTYTVENVAGDWGALRVMYEGTRQRLVPVLKVGEKFFVRPSRDELARLLS
jgi:glutaredoxin